MSLFSELHFVWSEQAQSEEKEEINCCIGSPMLHVVETPVRIRIRNERQVENVVLFQPFTIEYEITNLTEKCIPTLLQFDTGTADHKTHFIFAGELRSMIHLMPDIYGAKERQNDLGASEQSDGDDGGYVLRYTLMP